MIKTSGLPYIEDVNNAEMTEMTEMTEELVCPICLDVVKKEENEEIINKCCNRSYHKNCLEKWNKNCPTCRSVDSTTNNTNNTTIILIQPQPPPPQQEDRRCCRKETFFLFFLSLLILFGLSLLLFCLYKVIEETTFKKHL